MKQYNIEKEARKILEKNTKTGKKDGRVYTFNVPSAQVYPFQWFWDSCFHAIVWARLGEVGRAKEELRALLAWQQEDGFIPHVIFWHKKYVSRSWRSWHKLQSKGYFTWLNPLLKPNTTAEMQPPILAQAVERIAKKEQNTKFTQEVLLLLEKYYRNLLDTRSPQKDGLISIICQYESGLDYSPAYDNAIGYDFENLAAKPFDSSRKVTLNNKILNYNLKRIFSRDVFQTKDVLVNSIFIQGLQSLARLADSCKEADIARWAREQAQKSSLSLINKCYDKETGLFWNLDGKREVPSKIKTIISLMPLIIEDLPKTIISRIVNEYLLKENEFWTEYPVASVAKSEPTFNPNSNDRDKSGIWRGPLSMNTNWFLVHGLRQYGYGDVADEIALKSKKLVQEHGFNEFYNPITGEGVGAPDFGWATLVIDL